MPVVKEILPSSPFHIAGRLDLRTGEEEFTVLSQHELFKNNVIERRTDPITVYSLVGPIGIGRTWTLAWLGRQARYHDMGMDGEEWEAALVPGIGGGGEIRNVFESIFASTEQLRSRIVDDQESDADYPIERFSEDPYRQVMDQALTDRSTWAVLTGNRGRFPAVEGVDQKPKWTNRDTQLEMLSLWFRLLKESGIENMIILLDEMEILATRLSKNKLIDLSDGLRAFFDMMESSGESTPNVQMILSLTTEGAIRIDPSVGSEEVAGWVQPLQARMASPVMLETISLEDAKRIAEHVLEVSRVEEVEGDFTPYTEEAIEVAYESSNGLPREFSKILNEIHQIGYDDEVLDREIAEEALDRLGLTSEELV